MEWSLGHGSGNRRTRVRLVSFVSGQLAGRQDGLRDHRNRRQATWTVCSRLARATYTQLVRRIATLKRRAQRHGPPSAANRASSATVVLIRGMEARPSLRHCPPINLWDTTPSRELFSVHVDEVFFVLAEMFVQLGVRHQIERNGRGPRPLVVLRIGECKVDHHVAEV